MQSRLFPRNPRKYAALVLWPHEEVALPTPIMMLPKKQSRIPQTDDLCVKCYRTVSERHLLAPWQGTKPRRDVREAWRDLGWPRSPPDRGNFLHPRWGRTGFGRLK